MPIETTSPEQLAATQQELRKVAFIRQNEDEIGNVGLASDLTGPAYLTYGRHRYKVPPVPYQVAVELEEIKLNLDRLAELDSTPEVNKDLLSYFERAVRLFPRIVKPTFGFQRLLWRWASNPFRDASPADIFQLLYFFCACRTRSAVQFEAASMMRTSRHAKMQLIT